MTSNILIVTGEASGDLHGANLVRSLVNKKPDLSFCGMGGPELASCDVEILFDAAKISVVGIFEVVSHLGDIFLAQKILRRRLRSNPPDLLIIIDLPDFNLMLAKKAKQLGIPVFYYITPQVWAWRSGRVKTIRKRVDKIGVILPFEEDFFRRYNIDAHYVGHPLLDVVHSKSTKKDFLQGYNLPEKTICVGLLPGSRRREIASLLPDFLEAARLLQESSNEKVTFFLPQAATISKKDLDDAGLSLYQATLDIRVVLEERYQMMASCNAVVAASGTVTLELAILEVPMVVTYRLSALSYRIAKMLVKLDHFSLVNLIAGYEAVPELLQDEVTPENIAENLKSILASNNRGQAVKKALAEVRQKLGSRGASDKAAEVALQLLEEKTTNGYKV